MTKSRSEAPEVLYYHKGTKTEVAEVEIPPAALDAAAIILNDQVNYYAESVQTPWNSMSLGRTTAVYQAIQTARTLNQRLRPGQSPFLIRTQNSEIIAALQYALDYAAGQGQIGIRQVWTSDADEHFARTLPGPGYDFRGSPLTALDIVQGWAPDLPPHR